MRKIGLYLMVLCSVTAVRADNFNVFVQATGNYDTNTIGGCGPNYPCDSGTQSMDGAQHASAMVSGQGTTSSGANPPLTTSSYLAYVSATEGHVAMSFDASAEGIGMAEGGGRVSWQDVLTVGGVAPGTYVYLTATLSITAEFLNSGTGWGTDHVESVFDGGVSGEYLFQLGSSGTYTPSSLTLPATVTRTFLAFGGEQIPLSASVNGYAEADATSDWSLVSTESAHYTITSTNPDVTLTLASGCDITNGYGCDSVPGVPEPSSLLMLSCGLLSLSATLRRKLFSSLSCGLK